MSKATAPTRGCRAREANPPKRNFTPIKGVCRAGEVGPALQQQPELSAPKLQMAIAATFHRKGQIARTFRRGDRVSQLIEKARTPRKQEKHWQNIRTLKKI